MAEIDELLRDAFERAAQPADPTGVADAIRTRLDAGETGATASSSSAPGWGGGAGRWLGIGGAVVVAAVAGGTIGASGLLGAPVDEVVVVGHTTVLDAQAQALSCPGGPVVRNLGAGTRVLAMQRNEASDYLAVRDPNDFSRTIWLSVADVAVDAGQAGIDDLPVGENCPVASVVTLEPQNEPTQDPVAPTTPTTPGGGQQPEQPGDVTPPQLGTPSAEPQTFYNDGTTTITVTATDDVGVAGVQLTWSGAHSGSAAMTASGGGWRFVYDPPDDAFGQIEFTLVARDAAGNLSTIKSVTVDHQFFG